jgi:hypothetical protein
VLAGAAVAGALCGVAAKAADTAATDWVNDLADFPAAYLLALALLARTAPSAVTSAVRAAAFFTTLCLAYYSWSSIVLGFGGGRFLFAWTAVALTVVPLLAAVLQWASRRDDAGAGLVTGLVMGLAAAAPLADGAPRRLWSLYISDALDSGVPLHLPQAVLDVTVAAIVAGLLPRHRRTRLVALALVLPLVFVAGRLIDAARSMIGL